ncbi:hypothetical protein [Cellulophaga sp. Hel_I_12]|uniref:hypothetical protein n=1 Tax=Cellulophaga sp. Hel_I_12 TaxID=1249972 RepID=UPI00064839FF|nr:hypothetical protein [Cellulophaga sp. Hel_I_12]|tara:strand:+ start:161 stop:1114 length:954 start_codon:yes stop_codon:yes gene_type:complete
MKKSVEWKYLIGLNQLYKNDKTNLKIENNSFIKQVLIKQKKLIKPKMGNPKILEAKYGFKEYYEEEFLDYFQYYSKFFEKAGLESNAHKTYNDDDLKSLAFIYYQKDELKKHLTTEYTFSARVFKGKGAKYLTNKPSLRNAVLQLLEIEEFPEKDPKNSQWRFVVDCENPKLVVICENIACLKVPYEYKQNNIELWYVGGNNTNPLKDIPTKKIELPLFYFCDWDHHGLSIFSRIKGIFKEKGKEITLIEPNTLDDALPVNSPHHKSKWRKKEFSGLKSKDFSEQQQETIKSLIQDDTWVEEESMNLVELLSIINEI